jgi:hypothetical protein
LFIFDEECHIFDLLIGPCRLGSAFLKSNATCIADDLGVARLFERKPQALGCGHASALVFIELPNNLGMLQIQLFLFPHLSDNRHNGILSNSESLLAI